MDAGTAEGDWTSITHRLFVNYALQIAPMAILYYDYFLTLSDEIKNYWPPHRPLTWISGTFLATRYLTLLGYIPVFVSMVWGTKFVGCGPIQSFHFFLEVVLQVPVGYLCALRVYALYASDRRILAGIVFFGLSCLAVAAYLATTLDNEVRNFFWYAAPLCGTSRSVKAGRRLALAWAALLFYDILIFLLTAVRAFRVWTAGRIVQVVLRDGVMYFCALAAVNLVNIVTLLVATPLLRTTFASPTNVLSVVLISRLMLNLRSDTVPGTTFEDTELSTTRVDLDSVVVSQLETQPFTNHPSRVEHSTRARAVRFDKDGLASSLSTSEPARGIS